MKLISLFLTYSLVLLPCFSKTQTKLKDFQRYDFNVLKSHVEETSREKLDKTSTKIYSSYAKDYSALVYYTTLLGLDATVNYTFFKDRLIQITYRTDCFGIKGISYDNAETNACTTQTLKEFFSIREALENIFSAGTRCVGCRTCFTENIKIPSKYSNDFENKIIKKTNETPETALICVSWKNYNHDSTVKLIYGVGQGWVLTMTKD